MSMEARLISAALAWAILFFTCAPSFAASHRSENFFVTAATPQLAKDVCDQAESYRKSLAIYWLGHELPRWRDICPITVHASPKLGAGGETKFTFHHGTVGRWEMVVRGSRERVLDSVLPHEITHTILATHFAPMGKPVPRWADEGACTTIEHISERSKFDHLLIDYLHRGMGMSFQELYHIKDYPADPLPLYAQGYSLVSFLIAQGGPRKFIEYVRMGMTTEDWPAATEQYYGYKGLGSVKNQWLAWVSEGGGAENVIKYAGNPASMQSSAIASATEPVSPMGDSANDTEFGASTALPPIPGNRLIPIQIAPKSSPKASSLASLSLNGPDANSIVKTNSGTGRRRIRNVTSEQDPPSLATGPIQPRATDSIPTESLHAASRPQQTILR